MTNQANINEWLNKAFQLAFFLHGERETAKKIVFNAMTKLETASNAQFKRYYYTPTGRTETARATRSRVSLSDLQLLQRLVFVESENFEREKESFRRVCEKKLLTYFIKHLVRISLKRNSFYVTLGVARILHNYTTGDAMEIYNVVIQDPERVHDDYYYRSRKGVLMKELKARFGELLETVKGTRGEERFSSRDAAAGENLTETALECLKFFTPWNSACAMPEKIAPFDEVIKPFHFDKNDPDAEHRIEVNRIHATLHPDCFSRLTGALKLPSPQEKMEIPKFMTTPNDTNFDDNDWRNPPGLETDELETLKSALTAQAENRKALSAGFLRVVVDGEEQARFDPAETGAVRFDLDESAELIEVRAAAPTGEITLATHLLSFEELAAGEQTGSVTLEGGQKVSFSFAPERDEDGEIARLRCGVKYSETAWPRRFALALRRARFALGQKTNWLLKPALAVGLVLLALTFGWLILRNPGSDNRYAGNTAPGIKTPEILFPPSIPKEEVNSNRTANNVDENAPKNNTANNNAPKESVKPQPNKPAPKRENKPGALPEKELPVLDKSNPRVANKNNRPVTDDIDENGVLKLPVRDNNLPKNSPYKRETNVRGGQPGYSSSDPGKSFGEIKLVYVEISGDLILGDKIREQIAADIQRSGAFVITTDKEAADAALKIYVRHESDADTREEASVAAIVRLVNAKGFVVYPNRPRISGWKYVGTLAKLPARISGDLIKAKRF